MRFTPDISSSENMKFIRKSLLCIFVSLLLFGFGGCSKKVKPESFINIEYNKDTISGNSNAVVKMDFKALSEQIDIKQFAKMLEKDGRVSKEDLEEAGNFSETESEMLAYLLFSYDIIRNGEKLPGIEDLYDYASQGLSGLFSSIMQGYGSLFGNLFSAAVDEHTVYGLKNGETVGVRMKCIFPGYTFDELCKGLNLNIPEEYTITIKGLEEGTPIDLMWHDIKEHVSFKGPNGNGQLLLDMPEDGYVIENEYYATSPSRNNRMRLVKDNNLLGEFILSFSKTEELSEGDEIQVTVQADQDLLDYLASNKLAIVNNAETIIVSKLDEYVQDISTLTESEIGNLVKSLNLNGYITSVNTCVLKPSAIKYSHTNNAILVTYTDDWNYNRAILIGDLVRKPDGTLYHELDSVYSGNNMDEIISNLQSMYILTEHDLNSLGIQQKPQNNPVNNNNSSNNSENNNDNNMTPEEQFYYLQSFMGKKLIVNEESVRIRRGPSTSSEHLTIDGQKYYDKDAEYEIIDVQFDESGNLWFEVEYKLNTYTWIREDFVTIYDFYS